MKKILLISLENEPGALSRVVGLFSQRGYNIDSLSVSPTEDITISSVTIQTNGDQKTIEQIEKQLHKLINVVKIIIVNQTAYIEQEIALIKIMLSKYEIKQIKYILKIFNSKIIKINNNIYIITITGENQKINSFLKIIKKISKIIEISRSGIVGITK